MAKVTFSDNELRMMNDARLMPVKQDIIEKLELLFSEIGSDIIDELGNLYAHRLNIKITKGENLQRQPYVVLDVPQIKSLSNLCHFRVICWWGNHIRLQVFLSNIPAEEDVLNYINYNFDDWNILTTENLWDYIEDEVTSLSSCTFDDIYKQYAGTGYIRMDRIFPLDSLNTHADYNSSLQLYKNIYALYYGLD